MCVALKLGQVAAFAATNLHTGGRVSSEKCMLALQLTVCLIWARCNERINLLWPRPAHKQAVRCFSIVSRGVPSNFEACGMQINSPGNEFWQFMTLVSPRRLLIYRLCVNFLAAAISF